MVSTKYIFYLRMENQLQLQGALFINLGGGGWWKAVEKNISKT